MFCLGPSSGVVWYVVLELEYLRVSALLCECALANLFMYVHSRVNQTCACINAKGINACTCLIFALMHAHV